MIQARDNFLTFPNTRLGRLVPFSTFSSFFCRFERYLLYHFYHFQQFLLYHFFFIILSRCARAGRTRWSSFVTSSSPTTMRCPSISLTGEQILNINHQILNISNSLTNFQISLDFQLNAGTGRASMTY